MAGKSFSHSMPTWSQCSERLRYAIPCSHYTVANPIKIKENWAPHKLIIPLSDAISTETINRPIMWQTWILCFSVLAKIKVLCLTTDVYKIIVIQALCGIGICKYCLCYKRLYFPAFWLTLQICVAHISADLSGSSSRNRTELSNLSQRLYFRLPYNTRNKYNKKAVSLHCTIMTVTFSKQSDRRACLTSNYRSKNTGFPDWQRSDCNWTNNCIARRFVECTAANKGNVWLCIRNVLGWHSLEK
jgi:hypothetical protein